MCGSFEKLYLSCLRNCPLEQPSRVAGFEYVFDTNRFVGLYFLNEWTPSRVFSSQLHQLYSILHKASLARTQQQQVCNSPAKIRKFFNGNSSKTKKEGLKELKKNTFEVVMVSVEREEEAFRRSLADNPGWWTLPFAQSHVKNRLIRQFRVQNVPVLVLIDAQNKQLITTDGRRAMADDREALQFPWWHPDLSETLSGRLLSGSDSQDFSTLQGSYKGILFAANWCPPCRTFVKQLVETYGCLRAADKAFEIILCSSDRSEQSFAQFFSQMPWLALPYADERIRSLTRYFNVHGIPAFLILDPDNQLVTRHGRNAVLADPQGKHFPWYPEPMIELTEFTMSQLKEEISLIIFTEGSVEDVDFAKGVLAGLAEDGSREGEERLQLLFTGEDPGCDALLESLGLAEAPLPLLAILDVVGDQFFVCEEPDVSERIVQEFVSAFRADALSARSLSATKFHSETTVGGIPVDAISAVLGLAPPPQSMAQSVLLPAVSCNGS